jgi:hypothetical protein
MYTKEINVSIVCELQGNIVITPISLCTGGQLAALLGSGGDFLNKSKRKDNNLHRFGIKDI